MAKGRQIYFTQQEVVALLLTLEDWEKSIEEPIRARRLEHGLGTAWSKLAMEKTFCDTGADPQASDRR